MATPGDPRALTADEYFRHQWTLLGHDAYAIARASQVAQMHVLVIGLRGVGAEIAKCLALSGIQRLTLLDDDLVREEDLETNFLLRSGDRGKPKAKVVADRLNALCPFADVRTIPGALTVDLLLNYHVVVFSSSQLSREEMIAYNEFCRAQDPPVGFLLAESRGLFGSIFTDFGEVHATEIDSDSATIKEFRIVPLKTQFGAGNTAVLHVKETVVSTCCQLGDHLEFRDNNGHMLRDRKGNPFVCQVIEIVSTSVLKVVLNPHQVGGEHREPLQDEVKVALTRAMKMRKSKFTFFSKCRSFRQIVVDPGVVSLPLHLAPSNSAMSYHVAMQSIYSFRQCYGTYPESNNAEHIEQMMSCARKFLSSNEDTRRYTNQPAVSTQGVDFDLMQRLVRCSSSEFQPLSSLIASVTTIQALRFCGRMGPPLPPASSGQLQFFDILDMVSPHGLECTGSEARCQRQQQAGVLGALFGEEVSGQIQRASVAFSQVDSLTTETLKNCLCLGIGKHSPISILTDSLSSKPTIQLSSLSTQPVFSPKSAAWGLRLALEAMEVELGASFKFCDIASAPDHFEFWNRNSCVISGEPNLDEQRLWLDTNARIFSKPLISSHTWGQSARIESFVPYVTATHSELLLSHLGQSRNDTLLLDHLPPPVLSTHVQPSSITMQQNNSEQFELDKIATSSLEAFEWIFRSSISDCIHYLSNRTDDIETTNKLVWGIWTVVQRGHNVTSFCECLQEAWRICELLPVWIDGGESNRVLPIEKKNEHHMLLVISVGCIIAESLDVSIPSVEQQRRHLAIVTDATSNFSLLSNPRTPDGILSSLQDAKNEPLLIRAAERVRPTSLSLHRSYHLNFLHTLTHILGQAASLNTPQDFVSTRRLFGEDATFPPSASIVGALTMFSLIKTITGNKQVYNYSLALPGLASDSTAFYISSQVPLKPRVVRSIKMEATRAASVRVAVDNFTLWSQIVVPVSSELQNIERIIEYLECKFRATIHEIKIFGTSGASLFSAVEGDRKRALLKNSIFESTQELLSPQHLFYSSPFVLLSATAVDDDGDVILPPIRVIRYSPQVLSQ